MVDVGKGEVLDMIEHVFTQVFGETGRSAGGGQARQGAEAQGGGGADNQHQAHADGVAHVAGGDAVVDELCHQKGDQNLQDDLAGDEDRGQDGVLFILPDASHEFFDQGFIPPSSVVGVRLWIMRANRLWSCSTSSGEKPEIISCSAASSWSRTC